MPVRYILSSVWVRLSIFSPLFIIQYVGLYVFSLPIYLGMIERIHIYTLSYYHHQIGSMNYYPLFRVRSWNNGVRCMSFYILMIMNTAREHCNAVINPKYRADFEITIYTPYLVLLHYDDVIMGTIASQITSLKIVYSALYSGADQSKHQSSASLAFVWRIHRGPVNSPHKWPVTRKMSPFDDVIMGLRCVYYECRRCNL